jgi:hypothetical protein
VQNKNVIVEKKFEPVSSKSLADIDENLLDSYIFASNLPSANGSVTRKLMRVVAIELQKANYPNRTALSVECL